MSRCICQDASSGNLQLILWMNYLVNAKLNHFVRHKVPNCKRLPYNNILVKMYSPKSKIQVTLKVSVESVLHAQCSGTWALLVVGPRARYRRVPSPQLPRPPCQISRSGPWPRVTTAIVTCLGVTRTRHRTQQPWLITTAPVLQCSISNVLLRSFLLRFAHLLNWQCSFAVYPFSVHFRILIVNRQIFPIRGPPLDPRPHRRISHKVSFHKVLFVSDTGRV